MLYDLLFYTEKNNIPDTVSWNFIHKVVEFFNFGPSIRSWIKLFYTNIESCVIVNGHISEWFTLHRIFQGDALSPYLFILCAETLSVLIRKNQGLSNSMLLKDPAKGEE